MFFQKRKQRPYLKNSFMSSSESSACFALLLIIVLNSSKSICPFPSVSTSPWNKVPRTLSLLRRLTLLKSHQKNVREPLTIISWSSSSEGFWPISLKTAPKSFAVTVPSPFLWLRSKRYFKIKGTGCWYFTFLEISFRPHSYQWDQKLLYILILKFFYWQAFYQYWIWPGYFLVL